MRPNGAGSVSAASRIRIVSCSTATASRPWNCRYVRGGATTMSSGIDGFAFMKSTQSGWENYVKDSYTTIPPTADRMCATSMVASWKWSGKPASYPATNAEILDTVLEVFSMTYSKSVQDSLYRMGEAALAAVPEISEISMACPNMHFIPMNLSAFGLDNNNDVFLPTDEPHGQIECTVGRGEGAPRHCERSEAIHSGSSAGIDCFIASLLAKSGLHSQTSHATPATAGPA